LLGFNLLYASSFFIGVEPTTDEKEGEDRTPVPDESEGQEIINPNY